MWQRCGALFYALSVVSAFAEMPSERPVTELSIEELRDVRVTAIATGTAKPERLNPGVITVLTIRDLERMGARTLGDALEGVPGLHVSRSSHRYTAKYLVRGISTTFNPQTLVMLNGAPLTSLIRGDRSTVLQILPISMVARVEIIRGPGSAVHGADAFAGVINIVTRSAREIGGTELAASLGSFDSRQAWYRHGGRYGELELALLVDYDETDGHRRIVEQDAQTQLDRALGTRASHAPGPVALSAKRLTALIDGEKGKWRLRGSFHAGWNLGTGPGIAEALDPDSKARGSRATFDLTHHEPDLGPGWELDSRFSFYHATQQFDRGLRLFPPGADLGGGSFPEGMIGSPDAWERQLRLTESLFYSGFENHRLRLGVGYSHGHLYRVRESKNFAPDFSPLPELRDVTDTSAAFLPESLRTNFHALLQDEWGFHEDWEATAGVRYDYYSDFKGTVNPRLALVWAATPRLNGKLLYGAGFRAPSFAELYTTNNPVTLGNRGLKPERIDMYELAWSYDSGRDWSGTMNLFHYKVRDLITFVRDPGVAGTTAQNFASQDGTGVELESRFAVSPAIRLQANYGYQNAVSKSGSVVAGAPNHHLYARVDWEPVGEWLLGTQVNWVGKRARVPEDSRPALRGFATLDFLFSTRLWQRALRLSGGIRNLLDADVREPGNPPSSEGQAAAIPGDLPQEGRSFRIEAAYSW
ncbi:MAG: TonB-dependent receptor [Oligoflexia bacterium]|nr:TonB-dependent receptor [Oligoflexia bacterium]